MRAATWLQLSDIPRCMSPPKTSWALTTPSETLINSSHGRGPHSAGLLLQCGEPLHLRHSIPSRQDQPQGKPCLAVRGYRSWRIASRPPGQAILRRRCCAMRGGKSAFPASHFFPCAASPRKYDLRASGFTPHSLRIDARLTPSRPRCLPARS